MNEFINPDSKDLLEKAGMADFPSLWERDDPWFEEPNQGRTKDGWSGVCRVEIGGRFFFLKKQENYLAYSISKPLGQSLVEREFNNLKTFADLKIPAMTVVYCAVRKSAGNLQGMILTEALDSYQPLDEIWKNGELGVVQKRKVMCAIADLINLMHTKNMVHTGLYPKHIFIHAEFASGGAATEPECRLIDLEKARPAKYQSKKQLRDLNKFYRYSGILSRTDKLAFLLRYLGQFTCNSEVRKFLKKVQSVSKK
jgi:hypothetical protein